MQLCAACHGENGVPQEKTTPIIWGQTLGYQYLQLRDYKNGDRKNDQMTPVVEMLERERSVGAGRILFEKAVAAQRRAGGASGCGGKGGARQYGGRLHRLPSGQYQGEGTQPRLAGQNEDYMAKTMLEIRSGERANNPGMTTLMKATSPDDIKALAEYLAGLDWSASYRCGRYGAHCGIGEIGGGLAVVVLQVGRGTARQQQLDDLGMAKLRGHHQRGTPSVVDIIQPRPARQQQLRGFDPLGVGHVVGVTGCPHQSRQAVAVTGIDVDAGLSRRSAILVKPRAAA